LKNRQEALVALLEQAGPTLHALLLRLTLRQDVADDLMQNLFLKLSQSPGFFQATCRKAYARRAAINLALNWRRDQSRRHGSHESIEIEQLVSLQQSPEKQLEVAEQMEQILDSLGGLSELSRQVVVMRYLLEHDFEYIANELAKTPHQVRGLCHKGIQHLRQLLMTNAGETPR